MKILTLCKFLLLYFISAIILVPSYLAFSEKTQKINIQVTVDPRVELLSIIFRLAGNPEYNKGCVFPYIKNVEEHFKNYKKHAVVKLARKLRVTQGISYNAPMDLAVYVTDAFSLKERMAFDPIPTGMDKRWTARDAIDFLTLARLFSKETDFKSFIDKQQKLYNLASVRMQDVLHKHAHIEWFDKFFGGKPGVKFTVSLGMLNGGHCYGASIKLPDGCEEKYCVLGVWMADEDGFPQFDQSVIPTVVHEFCHSYANPLVDKYESELKKAGKEIYRCVSKEMKRQAYARWKSMIYESLVRACVVRYVLAHDGNKAEKKQILSEEKKHFYWIEDLSNVLGKYEAKRKKFQSLDAFFPRIVEFFNEYSKNAGDRIAKKKAGL